MRLGEHSIGVPLTLRSVLIMSKKTSWSLPSLKAFRSPRRDLLWCTHCPRLKDFGFDSVLFEKQCRSPPGDVIDARGCCLGPLDQQCG